MVELNTEEHKKSGEAENSFLGLMYGQYICSQAELRMFELFRNCSAVMQTYHVRQDSFNIFL